jgi:hypothetical protein
LTAAGPVIYEKKGSAVTNCITNILILKYDTSFLIFWDEIISMNPCAEIDIYRATNLFVNSTDIDKTPTYKVLTNENFFEDTSIDFGIPYYYLVIVNRNKIIIPGKNCNISPVFFGFTNYDIKVEREVFSKTNESMLEFLEKFKN